MRRILFLFCLAACGGDDEKPAREVRIYGESYIEDGMPAEVFVDGWTVGFERFLVVVGELEADGQPIGGGFRVWDLADGSGGAGQRVVEAVPLAEHLAFRIAPAAGATAGNATADEVALVAAGGFSLYVEGSATKGDVVKRFAWGFDSDTTYRDCHTGGELASTITIHGDHLFYDDLIAEAPDVSFDVLAAADADDDGEITPTELAGFAIGTLPNYQVGSYPVGDLWAFIRHQTSTVGHIDGEGHCDASRAE